MKIHIMRILTHLLKKIPINHIKLSKSLIHLSIQDWQVKETAVSSTRPTSFLAHLWLEAWRSKAWQSTLSKVRVNNFKLEITLKKIELSKLTQAVTRSLWSKTRVFKLNLNNLKPHRAKLWLFMTSKRSRHTMLLSKLCQF